MKPITSAFIGFIFALLGLEMAGTLGWFCTTITTVLVITLIYLLEEENKYETN